MILLLNTVQLYRVGFLLFEFAYVIFLAPFSSLGSQRFRIVSEYIELSAAVRTTGLTKDASYLGPLKMVNYYLWIN